MTQQTSKDEKIAAIVKILKDNEGELSDGYKYYCNCGNDYSLDDYFVDEKLKIIALEILAAIDP